MSLAKREALTGYLLISPWIIGFLVFTVGPLVGSFWLSFQRYGLLSPPAPVGLTNYVKGVTSDLFGKSLSVTARFCVTAVPIGVFGSLFCAILLNQKLRGLIIYRTVFFLPSVVSSVAATLMWSTILNARLGLLNYWIRALGITPAPNWLGSTEWALPALLLIATWTIGGPNTVVFLGALQSIPQEFYEASRIDGASTLQSFRHITLPLLTPTIFFQTILAIIWVFAQGSFTMAYLSTGGGPNRATYFYSLYVYENAFQFSKLGLASALAWILFVLLIMLTYIYFRVGRYWVYYAADTA
jgi:multiple sugar transport system permease protein